MKDYAEIYVSLREEIMQAIVDKSETIKAELDINSLNEIERTPELYGYILERKYGVDTLRFVHISDICSDAVVGYFEDDERCEDEFIFLHEFETDSLIDIYNELCKL
jgi:hypothetical protein